MDEKTYENVYDKIAELMPVMKSNKSNVEFRSITPLLASPYYKSKAWDLLITEAFKLHPTCIVGIDSRGYIMGEVIANALNVKFVMAAKANKLPGEVIKSQKYKTEYDVQDSLEICKDVIDSTDRVIVVDDILATGGSALNCSDLIIQTGANLVGFFFLGEIASLAGKSRLLRQFPESHVYSVCQFKKKEEEVKFNIGGGGNLMSGYYPKRENPSSIILLFHHSRRGHAEDIVKAFPYQFVMREISWKHFPDGWSDIKLMNPEELKNRHVVFLMAMDNIHDILEQLFVCMILPAQFLKSFVIDINYFAPGTHERVTQPGVLATAETMSRMFNTIPHSRSGPTIIQITDLHALANQFYFVNCFVNLISSIPMMLEIKPKTIVYPDDGSFKRFGPMIPGDYPSLICTKMREGKHRSVKISDFKNFPKHYLECPDLMDEVIIIDDLCHSGSTLVECAKVLKEIPGVKAIDVWVTHSVFENGNYLHFMKHGKYSNLFRHIHVTDSILSTSTKIMNHVDNIHFKVHSSSANIGKNLLSLIQPGMI